MDVKVKHMEAEKFHILHAVEQDRLDRESPELGMKARLRPYFPVTFGNPTVIFYVEKDEQVIAIGECVHAEPDHLDLSYVTVDPRYRNQGLANAVVGAIVGYMRENGQSVLNSSYYTDTGDLYLKQVLRRVGTHGITLLEDGKAIQQGAGIRP